MNFLWLQMLSKLLNNGDLRNSRGLSAGSDSLHWSSNRQSELKVTPENVPNAPPRSRTSFSDTITSCRKTAVVL